MLPHHASVRATLAADRNVGTTYRNSRQFLTGVMVSVCYQSNALTLAGVFEIRPVKIAQSYIGLWVNPRAEVAMDLPDAKNASTVELAPLARQ